LSLRGLPSTKGSVSWKPKSGIDTSVVRIMATDVEYTSRFEV
jgi:hypothetical protein